MAKKITIKEIAKKAGVSIGTVDRVFHNRGRVAEATRQRVLQIAEEGNYSSNVYARSLRLNRAFTIAVLLPEDNYYWKKQSEGIHEGIAEHAALGFEVKEYSVQREASTDVTTVLQTVLESEPDGLILTPIFLKAGDEALHQLQDSGVPFVFVDSNIPEVGQLSFVGQDAYQSGMLAGSLLDRGYIKDYVCCVVTATANDLKNQAIQERVAGLRAYYESVGRAKDSIREVNLARDQVTVEMLRRQLVEERRPVHVFVPNSRSYLVAAALADYREQLQLRMVGYDLVDPNIKLMEDGTIDFVIHQKPKMQGYLAVQSLYKHLMLKTSVPMEQYMPLELITKQNIEYTER
ncbi:LacI family DNA-binding transcriptional regulator [Reichenbachiella sp. MSK19-1]|uniref:LacI family DNA-binding transcriptional regulator n=1 Tax=Reichenbachiella sp. MSK19-1 TaxID=1897631 RepID=UPI000E6D4E9A|nr:LacI family DNA-binding transcriptional regulator [Reichenbachiella sp. MSK19-1]RJE70364.1 hypothetical protein BGP76_09715 [Reichenbachiella sp. MSK19-1]